MKKASRFPKYGEKWLRIILVPIISISFPYFFAGLDGWQLLLGTLITCIVTMILWEANRFFMVQLRHWLRWEKYPVLHIVAQLGISISFTLAIVSLILRPAISFFYLGPESESEFFLARNLSVIFTVILNAVYEGLYFAERWKLNIHRAEILKRENIRSQFESLKHQVNPHFLFNSLNTLTTLIEENEALAQRFVQELSNVYRYVLESKDYPLIELDKEIKFIQAYSFLLKMRFGENLHININTSLGDNELFIPPLTLQLLVENAVKHNLISNDKPLTIIIESADGYLVVSNNLQRKNMPEDSTKVGLNNIRERYAYLCTQNITVEEDTHYFRVLLPLLAEPVPQEADKSF